MKNKLRELMINKRKSLTLEQVNVKSNIIIEKIVDYLEKNNYQNVLIFMNMNNEVMATKLLEYNFNVYITKTMPKANLKVNKYNENELILHPFGYYESNSTDYVDPNIIDVAIVPGLAFDINGNRLGYGMGYYDRFLLNYPDIKRIAVCFDFQIVDNVPIDKYDQQMDYIISENQTIKVNRK